MALERDPLGAGYKQSEAHNFCPDSSLIVVHLYKMHTLVAYNSVINMSLLVELLIKGFTSAV